MFVLLSFSLIKANIIIVTHNSFLSRDSDFRLSKVFIAMKGGLG